MENKLTKDVRITVRGIQRDEDGNELVTETVSDGEYYERGGSIYLFYEEFPEEESRAVKHTIKCKENVLELTKKGLVNARIIFEPGQTHMTDYATPYGLLRLGVKTRGVNSLVGENVLEIQAEYALTSEEEILNECEILIRVESLVKSFKR